MLSLESDRTETNKINKQFKPSKSMTAMHFLISMTVRTQKKNFVPLSAAGKVFAQAEFNQNFLKELR